MSRELKNGRMASFKIKEEILEQLENYSDKTGITKTRIVEDAIKLYLKDKEEK